MTVRSLSIHQFRNLNEAEIYFSPSVNYIRGENGAGKTNIMEALYCSGTMRSFRKASFSDMLGFGTDYFRLETEFCDDEKVFIYFDHEQGVSCGSNGKKTSAKEVISKNIFFAITREMFNLMYYSPADTRAFFDRLIVAVEPDYAFTLGKFKKILEERNAVLRSRPVSFADLDVWDVFYIEYAQKITTYRHQFIERLNTYFSVLFSAIFNGYDAKVVYRSSFESTVFEGIREEDTIRGTTGMGPHRDRYELSCNDHKSVSTASQGQAKSSIMALVAAVIMHMLPDHEKRKIVLLDDVFEELDTVRKERVFELYTSMNLQLFITGIHPYGNRKKHDAEFVCQNGTIERE